MWSDLEPPVFQNLDAVTLEEYGAQTSPGLGASANFNVRF